LQNKLTLRKRALIFLRISRSVPVITFGIEIACAVRSTHLPRKGGQVLQATEVTYDPQDDRLRNHCWTSRWLSCAAIRIFPGCGSYRSFLFHAFRNVVAIRLVKSTFFSKGVFLSTRLEAARRNSSRSTTFWHRHALHARAVDRTIAVPNPQGKRFTRRERLSVRTAEALHN